MLKAACLNTLLNGWCSARRFGEQQKFCRFGCGAHQDCIEHYLTCSTVAWIGEKLFMSPWGTFEERLAVGCPLVGDRVKRAFFLYGLLWLFNHKRKMAAPADRSVFANAIRCRMLWAVGKSSRSLQLHLCRPPARQKREHMFQELEDHIFRRRKRLTTSQSTA